MGLKDIKNPVVVWKPTETSGQLIKKFWRHISKKYNVDIDDFWGLHRWSVENLEDFWGEIWKMAKIVCSKPYDRVIDLTISMSERPEWFPGARLNFSENLTKFKDERIALILTGEERECEKITFSEVYRQACRYGAAMKKLGLKENDCIVCYMPNREEPIFAMLGAVATGAVWSAALPLLGAKAVLNRFRQTKPKFLFSIDRFLNDGVEKDMLSKLKEIADGLPSLEKIIITLSNPESRLTDISHIKNSCFLDDFLALAEEPDGSVPDLVFEQLPFSHPVFISYTSGTTGAPKALVHGCGNLLSMARDFWLHNNANRDNCWLSMSPAGWASWNMFTSMLALGVTVILYEGVPYFKSPTSLWDLVDKYGITNLFLTPSVLDDLEKRGYVPGEKNHLSSLKVILGGASVVKPQNYDFVYQKVKKDVIFGSAYGCTEIMSACVLLDQTLPVHRGEISSPALGIKVCCYNDAGVHVEGELGDMVITTPTPTLPLSVWGDTNGTVYKESYFNKFPDVFCTSDLVVISPLTKGLIVVCRSDDTLKPRGCRFGSSEIYNIVDVFSEVNDSLCVSQYNKNSDERAVLFLKMKDGHPYTEELVQRIRQAIERELSSRHVPSVILEVTDIPHNLNGKKMEIIVKKIINNMPYNAETVKNPECLKYFENVPELQGF